jgi:hypothetical protein
MLHRTVEVEAAAAKNRGTLGWERLRELRAPPLGPDAERRCRAAPQAWCVGLASAE